MKELQPTLENLQQIEPGDRIEFRAATRSGNRKAVRKITLNGMHGPVPFFEVSSYHGWSNFLVKPHEVVKIYKATEEAGK